MGTSNLCSLPGMSFLLEIQLFLLLKKDLDMLHCGIVESMFFATQVILILNSFLADIKCRILAFFNHKEGTVHGKSKKETDIRT